jgi:tRNA U34 5-carboxymethylaminomethyl modifying enzyme MnmG/GidA
MQYSMLSRILDVDLGDSISLFQLSQRQGVKSNLIYQLLPKELQNDLKTADLETALADLLYKGYIETQRVSNERINHNDNLKVPEGFDYRSMSSISHEMIERLERAKPRTFAQVRTLPGLTPTAISTILVHLTSAKTSSRTSI